MVASRTLARLVSALVFAFALSSAVDAQAPATLSGVVKDAGGHGLSGATVTVTPTGGGPSQTARSEAAGQYTLEQVAPGGYVTEVRFGTVVAQRAVTVAPGENTADFQLDIGQSSEIVTVTAQKREELIERAPVAVTALAGAELQRAGITQISELSDYVPNLHITNAGGRATINYLGLRGFINSNQTIDPSMAIYVDGVPVTDFFSTAQTLYDVERVEVIKGPQGTLYGVNSQAGVIDIRSRRPTNEWRGGASVQAGSFGSYATTAAVSGPLVKSRLFIGGAGSVNGRNGSIRNVVSNGRYDTQSGWDGRVRLAWTPTPRLDLAFTGTARNIDDHGGYLFLPTDLAAFNQLPALNGTRVGRFEQALDFEGFNTSKAASASGQATYYGAAAQVVYTTAWRRNRQRYAFDLDLTPMPFFATGDTFRVGNAYHELRLQSPGTARRLTWTTGLAYQNEERISRPYVQLFATNPFGYPAGTYSFGDSQLQRTFVGVFGQGTLRTKNERVGMTVGLRYDRATGTLNRAVGVFSGFPGQDATFANDIWLPKVGVDVRLSQSDVLYASIGRGWKTGGLNPYAPAPDAATYGPESSWTYEVGYRATRLDRRVRIDAALFLNRIAGFQDLQRSTIFSYLGNAERASSRGVDLTGVWAPVKAFEFGASLGVAHLRYDRYVIDQSNGVRLDGRRVPEVPTYNGSAHATYRLPFGAYVRGESVFTGPFSDRLYVPPAAGSAPSVQEYSLPSAQVYNLGAGVTRGRWTVGVLARNVADHLYFTRSELNFGFYSGYTHPMGVAGPRRVVAVQLSTQF